MNKVYELAKRAWNDQLVMLRVAIVLALALIVVVIGCTIHLSSRISDAEYATDVVGEQVDHVSAKVEALSTDVSSLEASAR